MNYSERETELIYSLAILNLELGSYYKSQQLLAGLVEVAPTVHDYWIALALCQLLLNETSSAKLSAHQALRLQPESIRAKLLVVTIFLNLKEYYEAGTYLGEIKDQVDAGEVNSKDVIKYYKAQLARFEFLLEQNHLQKQGA